jgi:hypothetical protein
VCLDRRRYPRGDPGRDQSGAAQSAFPERHLRISFVAANYPSTTIGGTTAFDLS